MQLDSAAPSIRYVAFTNNVRGLETLNNSTPILVCNDLASNTDYGLYNATAATAVIARNHYWGRTTGPTHAGNPGGTGDRVSNGVDYTPWAISPCILPPPPPAADFTATPTTGVAPLQVQFTNTSTGNFTSSLWNFGDGQTSTQASPIHVYQNPGVYTITLTVTGPGGSHTATKTNLISARLRFYLPSILRSR